MNLLSITKLIYLVERHGYALLFLWVLAEAGSVAHSFGSAAGCGGRADTHRKTDAAGAMACCVAGALTADIVWFYLGGTVVRACCDFSAAFRWSPIPA